jgi:hypothetical protein
METGGSTGGNAARNTVSRNAHDVTLLVVSWWPYGHTMDSRFVASRLRKNDRGRCGLCRYVRMTGGGVACVASQE